MKTLPKFEKPRGYDQEEHEKFGETELTNSPNSGGHALTIHLGVMSSAAARRRAALIIKKLNERRAGGK